MYNIGHQGVAQFRQSGESHGKIGRMRLGCSSHQIKWVEDSLRILSPVDASAPPF